MSQNEPPKEPPANILKLEKKVYRSEHVIRSDQTAMRERFGELRRAADLEVIHRAGQRERRDILKSEWDQKHKGRLPFEPGNYQPPATIDDPDTKVSRELHAIHYALEKLDNELVEAKKAQVSA